MELIHVPLSSADLVASAEPLRVPHDADRSRVLAVDEEVVVSDADGEFHGATVLGVEFERGPLVYLLRVGARLPPDIAAQRLTGSHRTPDNRGLHELLDLLGDLRRSGSDPATDADSAG